MDTFDLSILYCEQCISNSGCSCLSSNACTAEQVARFRTSLQRNGFVQIVAHGIDNCVISDSILQAERFFSQSLEYKDSTCSKDKARRGYSQALTENFASLIGQAGKPNDFVEKYRIGPIISEHDKEQNVSYYHSKEGRIHFFPNSSEDLERNFSVASTQYYPAAVQLCKKLMRLICYCEGFAFDYFENITDKHTSILSLNFYGPDAESERVASRGESPGLPRIRVAEHTDVSMLTIVAQSAELGEQYGGLEVLIRDESGVESYQRVPYVPGALVVNVGDCLHDWSEGRYKSAMHRVVSYPQSSAEEASTAQHCRYSMAYFFAPNYDAEMLWPTTPETTNFEIRALTYSTWRKNHIKKSMQQLKKQ